MFLTPEGEEEYGLSPVETPGTSAADFSTHLAGEAPTDLILTTHVDTMHLSLPGYFRPCVVAALEDAKARAVAGSDSMVRSGPWAFEVQRIGARPFFDFLLISPFATVKICSRGGDVAAFAEIRAKALAAMGPHAVGAEIQRMVSRWMQGQQRQLAPARVARIDLAASFDASLLGLEGAEMGSFVTRSEARATYRVADPVEWPRTEITELTRARAIKAVQGAGTVEEARKALFRILAAPGCKIETTFDGVVEEHRLDAVYARGRQFSGYSFSLGADVCCRIYDKTMEARKRGIVWVLAWLKDAGWTEQRPVMRAEFQLRSAAIKKYVNDVSSLASREMGLVLDSVDGIWSHLTGREAEGRRRGWLTYRSPTSSPQPTRWPIHRGWAALQDARWYAKRHAAVPINRDYIPRAALERDFRRTAPISAAASALRAGPLHAQAVTNRDRMQKQIQGLLASYIAAGVAIGKNDEPMSGPEAQRAIMDAARDVAAGTEDPHRGIEKALDLKYFRTAHQMLE